MEPLFTCPPPAALVSIPSQDCPEIYDQIDMMLIRLKQPGATFTASSIVTEATWTPFMTANDGTKIIKTPYFPNVVIPRGEILKEGGNDNTTINGIPKLNGRSFVGVTLELHNAKKEVRSALRGLAKHSALQPGVTNLEAVFLNRYGQIIAGADGSWIEVFNFMCGDPGTEGFNKNTIANVSFDLAPGWADNVTVFTPAAGFNPHKL